MAYWHPWSKNIFLSQNCASKCLVCIFIMSSGYLAKYNIVVKWITFVRSTPIGSIIDPASISAVQIPCVIVRENGAVPFVDHILDRLILNANNKLLVSENIPSSRCDKAINSTFLGHRVLIKASKIQFGFLGKILF